IPVGASLLAKNDQAPRLLKQYAFSLSFFASKLAPTKDKNKRIFSWLKSDLSAPASWATQWR
ncbi:hypothetical protein, partial [Pseudomonas fluorescens]|uniref:hypothetical protein n=1 Tax=Pseudomonas fluorescens TaxID=294 RepID=UPI0012401791